MYQLKRAAVYPRGLPYFSNISAGTLEQTTINRSAQFIGKKNKYRSEKKNCPSSIAATPSTVITMRSSNSRPKSIICALRLRETVLTRKGMGGYLPRRGCRSGGR